MKDAAVVSRTIHRIWLDDPLPQEFASYGAHWRDLHPTYNHIDWRRTAGVPPLRNQATFDAARAIFPRDWKRFQSDLLRLELLYLYGGVYADCDVEPLQSFEPLVELAERRGHLIAAWTPNTREPETVITQAVLIAPAANPFLDRAIASLADDALRYRHLPLWRAIGPGLITRRYNEDSSDVTVLPAETFYPQSNQARDRGETPDLFGAYAWHRWANTRDNRRGGLT